MNIRTMTNKQQLIWSLSIVLVTVLLYTFVRFLPELNMINALQSEVKSTQKKLAKQRKKKAPSENLDQLLAQIHDKERAIAVNKDHAAQLESRLAAFDSQELRLRISQLASQSQLNIKTNQAVRTFAASNKVAQKNSKNKKSKNALNTGNTVLPSTHSLMSRMAPGTMLYRPMQRLTLHGYYSNIQSFIYGLDNLPWQVTVVKLNLKKMPVMPPAGLRQLLSAEIVLAL